MQQSKHNGKFELNIDDIGLSFGGLRALDGVSFQVKDPGVFSIIGPNGAGKTCILNCINGFYRPNSGRIIFKDKELNKLPSHEIAKLGISRTFQNLRLYTGMSVVDNIMAGRYMLMKYGTIPALFYFGKAQREEAKHREIVEGIIDFLEIQAIRNHVVGILPYGMRKRVELGRALALDPEILLLDEPMAGMNLEEKEEMARFIIDICEQREIPVVLIEHDMGVVMDISDRISVLDFGHKIAEGTPDEIKINPAVISAYLGKPKE
jgi:branched-chain amino acid transport system ATP-binding protein